MAVETDRVLRKELEKEFVCLEKFGVTTEEIEALMEQCGYVLRHSRLFNTADRRKSVTSLR